MSPAFDVRAFHEIMQRMRDDPASLRESDFRIIKAFDPDMEPKARAVSLRATQPVASVPTWREQRAVIAAYEARLRQAGDGLKLLTA